MEESIYAEWGWASRWCARALAQSVIEGGFEHVRDRERGQPFRAVHRFVSGADAPAHTGASDGLLRQQGLGVFRLFLG